MSLNKPEVKNPAEKDSISKAVRRNINPSRIASLIQRGYACFVQRGGEALWREITFRVALMTKGEVWQQRADIPLHRDLRLQEKTVQEQMPLISLIVPIYCTPIPYLRQMIASVLAQSYANWELVLLDGSVDKQPRTFEEIHKLKEKRIKYTKLAKNEGISGNTNIGFGEATGEYIILLDHDDVLSANALFEVVKAINETGADFIYSDEIVLSGDLKKLGEYHFKPDFSPDTLRGCNYITHLACFSHSLLEETGYERREYDGAQDFDLFLRLTENAKKIHHIPKVLYFWRRHKDSTAADMSAKPYAIDAGARAVKSQLERMNLAGTVTPVVGSPGAYQVKYDIVGKPKISVIIPNMDHTDVLTRCLDSLYSKAGLVYFEVIVVENNSIDQDTFAVYEKLQKRFESLKVIKYTGPFNFSAVCNFGVRQASGSHILLLNNDVEILSEGFLKELLSYSQRSDIGAVGAKLFYPDDTIQHGGVFIGLGGSAGHSHKGHPSKSGGDMYRLATTQNMCAVTGACLMTKTSLYKGMGGLDEEDFAVAYNDVDYCLRLWNKGYLNVMTPFATAYHHESKSRGSDTAGGEKQQRYEKEKARFCQKYAQLMEKGDPYYNPHLTYLYENYGYK
ncbi:MAG: glycosyltransferase family 2 protein [Oscillospiraceae bacterium]